MEAARPAVAGVGPALDHAVGFHVVEDAHHRHRLDVGQLGEPRLADALVPREMNQRPALHKGQPERLGRCRSKRSTYLRLTSLRMKPKFFSRSVDAMESPGEG